MFTITPSLNITAASIRRRVQKTGFLLEHYRDIWNPSDNFFAECQARIGKNKRCSVKCTAHDTLGYNRRWRLVAPHDLLKITSKEASFNV